MIKICGVKYQVELFENNHPDDKLGSHFSADLTIKLQNKSCKYMILMHEVIEAINYQLDLGLDHKQISAIDISVMQFFTDNNFLNEKIGMNFWIH